MHTEDEFIVKTILTARKCIANRDRFLEGNLDPKFTNGEVITYAFGDREYQDWLDDEDKQLTPSATGRRAQRWCRQILNGNSNDKLFKLGLVKARKKIKNGKKVKTKGMVLTDDGMNLPEEKLIQLVHGRKILAKQKKPKPKLYGYYDKPVRSIKVRTKKGTKHYKDSNRIKVDARKRAGANCEICSKEFFPGKDGKPCSDVHHMFNRKSKDKNILSKVRHDHIDHVVCCCIECHGIIHRGMIGADVEFKAAEKVKTINKLFMEDASEKKLHAAKRIKIKTK